MYKIIVVYALTVLVCCVAVCRLYSGDRCSRLSCLGSSVGTWVYIHVYTCIEYLPTTCRELRVHSSCIFTVQYSVGEHSLLHCIHVCTYFTCVFCGSMQTLLRWSLQPVIQGPSRLLTQHSGARLIRLRRSVICYLLTKERGGGGGGRGGRREVGQEGGAHIYTRRGREEGRERGEGVNTLCTCFSFFLIRCVILRRREVGGGRYMSGGREEGRERAGGS